MLIIGIIINDMKYCEPCPRMKHIPLLLVLSDFTYKKNINVEYSKNINNISIYK